MTVQSLHAQLPKDHPKLEEYNRLRLQLVKIDYENLLERKELKTRQDAETQTLRRLVLSLYSEIMQPEMESISYGGDAA